MANNKIFLLTLGISSKIQLEEHDLDYWHKKKYLAIKESSESKKEINEKLIELNNAKEYLDKFAMNDLIRFFSEKKSPKSNIDIKENKKFKFDNNPSLQQEVKREVLLRDESEDYYFNRGCKKFELEDYDEAIQDFSKVLKLNPRDADAYLYRGYAKDELEDKKGAIEDFSKARQFNHKYKKNFYAYKRQSKSFTFWGFVTLYILQIFGL